MSRKPKITVSSLDLERLEQLLQHVDQQAFPGAALLQEELTRADILEPQEMPANTVTMNSTVSFKILPEAETFEMTLVYPKDVNGDPKRISVFAPVGSALLGLSVGQKIEWPVAEGKKVKVEIIKVTYQPERDGVFYR